jgi:hypothetical protein
MANNAHNLWRTGARLALGTVWLLAVAWTAGRTAASPLAQEATVTSTPSGPKVLVPDQVNVRLGPSTDYDQVGVLNSGQEAPAIGRSPGGDWIMISYPGVPGNVAWVYSAYVTLINLGSAVLPIIEPPATPTPRITPTIDPTLASQFNLGAGLATRLPTYTPAPEVVYPTFEPGDMSPSGIPPIVPIAGLVIIGGFGLLVSVLRGR